MLDGNAVEGVQGILDAGCVGIVRGVAGDVDDDRLVVGFRDVQRGDCGTGGANCGSQFARRGEARRRGDAQGDRVTGARVRH